jgi:hypothetical protein
LKKTAKKKPTLKQALQNTSKAMGEASKKTPVKRNISKSSGGRKSMYSTGK